MCVPGDTSLVRSWRTASYYWSMALLIFSMVIIIYGIGQGWNNPPWDQSNSHPVLEVFIFLFLMFWIALLEGCQISIVGLQVIDMEKYKLTHPRAYKASQLIHAGPNVERFLVGRQFLLLFCGFLVSRVGGAGPNAPVDNFYIGDWVWNPVATSFFWANSVLLMIVIIVPGQLVSQLLAADKMLGFFNLGWVAALYTVCYPCLFIESLGLTHSSYVLKDVLAWAQGIDTSTADPKKAMTKDWKYNFKCGLSISVVIFSGIFMFKGWAMGQSGATDGPGWENLPGGAAVAVSLLFLFIMACAEGLQVSALMLAKTKTTDFKDSHPLAYKTCLLLFEGRNMLAFLVGRQFFVAMMMVLLGRVTGYAGSNGVLVTGSDWGMGAGFNQWALQTGFLGAVFTCNVAQLASQVTASIFPIQFINNRPLNWLLRIMLLVEFSGIVNACWPLAWALSNLCKLEKDPFDTDPNVETHAKNINDRKRSLGIPVESDADGFAPYGLSLEPGSPRTTLSLVQQALLSVEAGSPAAAHLQAAVAAVNTDLVRRALDKVEPGSAAAIHLTRAIDAMNAETPQFKFNQAVAEV